MNISEEIKETLDRYAETIGSDPDLRRMQEVYEELEKLGVLNKSEYNLPPVDTVGRRLFEIQHRHKRELIF